MLEFQRRPRLAFLSISALPSKHVLSRHPTWKEEMPAITALQLTLGELEIITEPVSGLSCWLYPCVSTKAQALHGIGVGCSEFGVPCQNQAELSMRGGCEVRPLACVTALASAQSFDSPHFVPQYLPLLLPPPMYLLSVPYRKHFYCL